MNVIPACLDFVVMLLALQVHQIQFVNQPKLLQEFDGSIHCRTVNVRLPLPGQIQKRSGIQMLFGALNDFDKNAALRGEAHALGCKFVQERAALKRADRVTWTTCDGVANAVNLSISFCDTVATIVPRNHNDNLDLAYGIGAYVSRYFSK